MLAISLFRLLRGCGKILLKEKSLHVMPSREIGQGVELVPSVILQGMREGPHHHSIVGNVWWLHADANVEELC